MSFLFARNRERAELARHLRAGGVAFAGEDRGQRGANRPALFAVVRNPRLHQHCAEIGIAQVRACGTGSDSRAIASLGKLAISTEISSTIVQMRMRVLVAFDVESPSLGIEERQHVQRCQVAGRVVEEHVFRAVVNGQPVGDERAGDAAR